MSYIRNYETVIADCLEHPVTEAWNLSRVSSSSVPALRTNTLDGNATGLAYQNGINPVVGDTGNSPLFGNSSPSGIDLITPQMNNVFNGEKGGIFSLVQVKNLAAWSNSRMAIAYFRESSPAFNALYMATHEDGGVFFQMKVGTSVTQFYGGSENVTDLNNTLDPFTVALTWDFITNNRIRFYVNGVLAQEHTVSPLHIWAGGNLNHAMLGYRNNNNWQFDGWQSYFMLWANITPTDDDIYDANHKIFNT